MPKTLRESYIAGLIKLGETEVKRTVRKVVFTRKAGGFYYLGSSGSLRCGTTIAGSIPCSAAFKDSLLK